MSDADALRFPQSAVVPFRERDGRLEVALVTSRRRKRWVVPKGLVEPGLTPAASALQEALEEAGLVGRIVGGRLGTYTYSKWGGTCVVEVFAMAVERALDRWQEDFRSRVWLRPDAAATRLREPELRRIVRGLPARLA